ncbi:hypothetical protein NF867_05045 [Solitalea sp. MAHUQ-68]|uniref:Uncharacterized protein n=1 Tax=Solitalea agri TaxID=2953739 RepID=A0A9X2F090_9SPHI|nr:hypothetical protein [Solitalea agri]MCO4292227.1 hypothetical protein [Solitalea agri]
METPLEELSQNIQVVTSKVIAAIEAAINPERGTFLEADYRYFDSEWIY